MKRPPVRAKMVWMMSLSSVLILMRDMEAVLPVVNGLTILAQLLSGLSPMVSKLACFCFAVAFLLLSDDEIELHGNY